jgi:DNA-binding NtrC family response regulator
MTEGRFRDDLFYRLNVIHLTVPPLRERQADIPVLVGHFLGRISGHNGYHARNLTPEAMAALIRYPWPGNVRELENVVERIVVKAPTDEVTVSDLPPEIRNSSGVSVRPKRERRRTVVDDLYKRLREERESFWTSVYPMYMRREITRDHVRDVVRRGLEEARGNYRIVAKLFNLAPDDYKKFLNFLRKHECQLSFKEYRK